MSSSCGDSGGHECGFLEEACVERYEHGWAVAPRLRQEILLSQLMSRLENAAAKNVLPLSQFIFVHKLIADVVGRAVHQLQDCKSLFLALVRVLATCVDPAATYPISPCCSLQSSSGQVCAACRPAKVPTQLTS